MHVEVFFVSICMHGISMHTIDLQAIQFADAMGAEWVEHIEGSELKQVFRRWKRLGGPPHMGELMDHEFQTRWGPAEAAAKADRS